MISTPKGKYEETKENDQTKETKGRESCSGKDIIGKVADKQSRQEGKNDANERVSLPKRGFLHVSKAPSFI